MLRNVEQAREAVRLAASLDEVLDRYGIEVIGRGRERKAICPFHPDTDPSLGINVQKGVYFCHGCRADGDIFTFVQTMEGVGHVQAIRHLADLFHVDLSQYEGEPTEEEHHRRRLIEYSEHIGRWARDNQNKTYQAWVKKRSLDPDILDVFGVGYATRKPPGLDDHIAKELEADYAPHWKGRIVIPLRDDQGRTVGFRRKSIDGSDPKMVGPSEKHPLTQPLFYGFYEARREIREQGFAILVEGEVDVWQMVSLGYTNTIGMMGSKLTQEMAAWLHERGVRRVTVLPDGDEGGRRFAQRLAGFHYPGLSIRVAIIEDGDPDELSQSNPEALADALLEPKHAIEFAVDSLLRQYDPDTPTGKKDILDDLSEVLTEATELDREIAFSYLAPQVGLSVEYLTDYFRNVHRDRSKLQDTRSETLVLAQCLVDADFLSRTLLTVQEKHLFMHRHRRIFRIMADLFRAGDAVSVDTVALHLRNAGLPKEAQYVEQLEAEAGDAADYMLKDIRDKAMRRELLRHAESMSAELLDTSRQTSDLLSKHSAALSRVIVGGTQPIHSMRDLVADQMAVISERVLQPQRIVGLDFGPDWYVLNHTLHGLQEARYMIVAAPTNVGKTIILGEWAKQFGVNLHIPCLFMSFEMTADVMTNRTIASMSGVEFDKIVTGYMNEEEYELVQEAGAALAASPVTYTGKGALLEDAINLIRHEILQRDIKVVFIDYLQLMSMSDAPNRRDLELGLISGRLFALAQETGVRIVAAAQINREGSKQDRSDHTHVGEAFRLSQDCDIFYVVNEKTAEEIEQDGLDAGNLYGFISKNRQGRAKVGTGLIGMREKLHIREANRKAV